MKKEKRMIGNSEKKREWKGGRSGGFGRLKRCLAASVLLAGALTVTGAAGWAEEAKVSDVRVGSIRALGTAAPFVAKQLGYYEESGLEITVAEFADGAALMEAFAAGELDVALVGVAPAATWFMKGLDLKVVAGTNGGGHVLMTRADSGIDTVEDLKDKLVAEPSVATVTDALLRSEILEGAGLNPDMDVILVPGMNPADMATGLMVTREVDAMITWEPYASGALADYGEEIKILYDAALELEEEGKGFYPGNVVIASGDFVANRSQELETFLDIHEKTTEYLREDDSANEILASILQLDASVIEAARVRTDFQSEVDQEAVLQILQWSVDQGYLEELPDAEEFFRQGEA